MARRLRNFVFEEESSSDEDNQIGLRRPRLLRERNDWFQTYDESDFVRRFRLSKASALLLLEEIEHRLEYPSDM